jgi:hypothetical protein
MAALFCGVYIPGNRARRISLPDGSPSQPERSVCIRPLVVRTQHWIGNLSLAVEGELFGQAPLNQVHGPTVGEQLREELGRLVEVMLPLQDRTHKMMLRSLDRLRR